MATTTLGVKLDDASRERLKRVAQSIDRTPHWLIKQAIFTYLDQVERGQLPNDVKSDANGPAADGLPSAAAAVSDVHDGEDAVVQPFLEFAQSVQPQSVLRAAITAAYRRPETEAIPMLLEQARLARSPRKPSSSPTTSPASCARRRSAPAAKGWCKA
jgi:RHH-type proline utilization regulon transcriptional repressor/proline dehydrogenase/delta 1-pyrroline-5-carboxylate dehydrogenase